MQASYPPVSTLDWRRYTQMAAAGVALYEAGRIVA